MRGGAEVARQAHNLKAVGSIPAPATNIYYAGQSDRLFFNMYYIYILKLNNNQLYTGYTSDLKRRIREHKAGQSPFTSKRLPVELIHYEAYTLESDARRREHFLKTTEGKSLLRKQIRDYLVSQNLNKD